MTEAFPLCPHCLKEYQVSAEQMRREYTDGCIHTHVKCHQQVTYKDILVANGLFEDPKEWVLW